MGTEDWLAGDAFNVAARLQQGGAPGEILIGAATVTLAGAAVDVERLEPLSLKGKIEPVAVFRLLAVRASSERAHEASFVGRERELAFSKRLGARAQWQPH